VQQARRGGTFHFGTGVFVLENGTCVNIRSWAVKILLPEVEF
jgi:hypothetical protein